MNINEATQLRDLIAKQCGFGLETPRTADPNERNETGEDIDIRYTETPYPTSQACSAGEWPEDMGGNWTPDRIEANYAFSQWLDQQGDSIVPSSFSEWLGEDSILITRDENPNNDT